MDDRAMYDGVNEDDNQNNEIQDSGWDAGDNGNLDENQTDFPGSSGNAPDTDAATEDEAGANYVNSAGKYDDQTQEGTDQHRNALGTLIESLRGRGIDVDSLAQEAGVDSADVDNLEDDDVSTLAQYAAQAHPELTQQVYNRFPAAQSLLSRFIG